jgi:hypothetical protein
MSDTYVFDSSSLSHAFEEFSHSVASAYLEMREPREWYRLKPRILKRFSSGSITRRLLMFCDMFRCLIPHSVLNELQQDPYYKYSLDVLLGGSEIEFKYAKARGDIRGFSKVFKPRLIPVRVRKDILDFVISKAKAYGYDLSIQDLEGIALAIQENATLVTSDRKQMELAKLLGINVIYTIGEEAKELERLLTY